jgi:hypothetical protein
MPQYRWTDEQCRAIERQKNTAGFIWSDLDGLWGKSWQAHRGAWRRWREGQGVQTSPPQRSSRNTYAPVFLNAAVFDIETKDFKTEGYYGELLMCCILPLDSDNIITAKREYGDMSDRKTLYDTIRLLSQFDILIGHNINRFDLGWLASRLAYHNMPAFRRFFTIDTFVWAQRAKLKTRKSLANLIDYFGVQGVKTSIQRTSWSMSSSPIENEWRANQAEVLYHCQQDVIGNREVFHALYPRIMSSRYSSSSPIGIFDFGSGASVGYYENEEEVLK